MDAVKNFENGIIDEHIDSEIYEHSDDESDSEDEEAEFDDYEENLEEDEPYGGEPYRETTSDKIYVSIAVIAIIAFCVGVFLIC